MSDDRVFAKCAWRILPLVTIAYLLNYLDRTNVGFAALTMNNDLGFTPSVYGFGAGIFFVSYSLFQVPGNVMLHRVGARRWIFLLLATWGAAAAANALISGPASFYGLRFLLGVAESGFFPGIIFYLTLWFPKIFLGRATAIFMSAVSVSVIIGGPLSSVILGLEGTAGLHGWQWLFLLEGFPVCLLGLAVLRWLPDAPAHAPWLTADEKALIAARLHSEDGAKERGMLRGLLDPRVIVLGIVYGGINFASYGFSFWLPLLVQGMGFSNTLTGFVVALVYITAVPAMILWSHSSDRKGERIRHVVLAALFAAAFLALASVAQNNVLLLLALAGAAIGINSVLAPFYGVPALFLSGPAMASGSALVIMMGNVLGGFAGQYAIGVIREQTGGYSAVLATISAALLLSALLVHAVGRAIAIRPATAMPKAQETA